jgi:hypothetical protein
MGRRVVRFGELRQQYQEAGGLEDDLPEFMSQGERRAIRNSKVRDLLFEIILMFTCIYLTKKSEIYTLLC